LKIFQSSVERVAFKREALKERFNFPASEILQKHFSNLLNL
jgi:hypothetical protein